MFFNALSIRSVAIVLMNLQHLIKLPRLYHSVFPSLKKMWEEGLINATLKDGRLAIGPSHLTEPPRKSGTAVTVTVGKDQKE